MNARGALLLEMMIVVSVLSVLAMMAAPGAKSTRDQMAVRRAGNDVLVAHQQARFSAIFRGRIVRLDISRDSLVVVVEGNPDSVLSVRPGPAEHGVALSISAASIRFQGNGIGWGVSNASLGLRRGRALDSLVVSRTGRIRRVR